MFIECQRATTPLIAHGQRGPGLFTYVLDPLHFTALAVEAFAEMMGVLTETIRWEGPERTGLVELAVSRTHALPWVVPMVCVHAPGWIVISIHADHATAAGCSALRRAVLSRLPGWEHRATA